MVVVDATGAVETTMAVTDAMVVTIAMIVRRRAMYPVTAGALVPVVLAP
jgi:hypothetical protein